MRSFILGTDWWTDCDDAVALRILCRFVREKKARLLGIGINACMEYSVASVRGFLAAEGIEGIPIGIDLEATDYGGEPPYQERLAKDYAPEITNADAIDAVRLYRQILAAATEKIELIEVGYPQVIAAVLQSGADDICQKSGLELVRERVSKIWMMAGKWDDAVGFENNFRRNARSCAAGAAFCSLCPVPVTFLGYEAGKSVISGGARAGKEDHLSRVMEDYGAPQGRSSWDPMLVLMALIGDEERAGYKTVVGTASVDAQDGSNRFEACANGKHAFVIKNRADAEFEAQIRSVLD